MSESLQDRETYTHTYILKKKTFTELQIRMGAGYAFLCCLVEAETPSYILLLQHGWLYDAYINIYF